MTGLLSIVEAAAILQPFIGDLNAMNLLGDWRRRRPHYRQRLLRPPLAITIKGVVKYPKSEIERAIREMIALGTASPAK